jgi:hypothetical protein
MNLEFRSVLLPDIIFRNNFLFQYFFYRHLFENIFILSVSIKIIEWKCRKTDRHSKEDGYENDI